MTVPALLAYMDHVMTWWPITHVLVFTAIQEVTVRWILMTVKVLTVTMGRVWMELPDTNASASLVIPAIIVKKVFYMYTYSKVRFNMYTLCDCEKT